MKKFIVKDKRVGETPLQVIEALRAERPDLSHMSMAYAGRLDPMASGKLLLLLGEECKKQERYHGLDKEYEFEILFGFTSDTGDVLGMGEAGTNVVPSIETLNKISAHLIGTIELPYPHFSSKTVNGKPLFLWTLEGKIDEIKIPVAKSKIFKLLYKGVATIRGSDLLPDIIEKIGSLPPVTDESKELGEDFRREPIRERWRTLLEARHGEIFTIARFSTTCSSGTYIRSLAPKLAEMAGSTGLAYSIHRARIGRYIPLMRGKGFWLRNLT